MEDQQIIDLYWERAESAIDETSKKYGKYCMVIARNILHNEEDAEECVNDTYLRAWETMPPNRPNRLSTFLGKITRNLALNRYEKRNAKKRGDGQVPEVLSELFECIPNGNNPEQEMEDAMILQTIQEFLKKLPGEARRIFLQRYWYLRPIKEIAAEFSFRESRVKMTLLRLRKELKQNLEKEGIVL